MLKSATYLLAIAHRTFGTSFQHEKGAGISTSNLVQVCCAIFFVLAFAHYLQPAAYLDCSSLFRSSLFRSSLFAPTFFFSFLVTSSPSFFRFPVASRCSPNRFQEAIGEFYFFVSAACYFHFSIILIASSRFGISVERRTWTHGVISFLRLFSQSFCVGLQLEYWHGMPALLHCRFLLLVGSLFGEQSAHMGTWCH